MTKMQCSPMGERTKVDDLLGLIRLAWQVLICVGLVQPDSG